VLVVPLLDTSAFPEAPEDFATFHDGQVSFRHPPGWRETRGPGVVTLTAPGGSGAMVVLRRTATSDERTMRRLDRAFRRLTRGRRESIGAYDLDVPGHGDEQVGDQVFRLRDGRRERVETLLLPNGGGGLIHFAVRGPVSEDPAVDPRAITGSFRLED
jgi:hypothetical protein